MIDSCDVCRVPLKDLSNAVTQEYDQKVLSFCSSKCHATYLDDSTMYSEFEEDQGLE
jgi:ribosomal protein L24E